MTPNRSVTGRQTGTRVNKPPTPGPTPGPGPGPGPRRRYPPEILTPSEVVALLEACEAHRWTGRRNRALIALLYRTGLRLGEALWVMPHDLELNKGIVRVRVGKNGRPRVTGIDPWGAGEVQAWLAVRHARGFAPHQPVFCSASGKALTQGYIRRLLASLRAKAGIPKRVHAHGLRHTHAAELRSEGVDIGIISKQLGHRSITTTAVYLDHIAPQSVVDAIASRSWSHEG